MNSTSPERSKETREMILDYLSRIETLENEKTSLHFAKRRVEKALANAQDEIAALKAQIRGDA